MKKLAALLVGTTALLITGLQPLVLGQLAQEGRLSEAQIGLAAMIELLAIGIAASASAVLFVPRRLRLIGFTAAAVHAAANLTTAAAAGVGVILARGLAGLAGGVMLWIAIGLIARAERPERWSGSFLTVATLVQLAVAALMTLAVVPRYGANGVLAALTAISLATAGAALVGPRAYAPLPQSTADASHEGGDLDLRSFIALGAIFSFMGGVTAVWVYLESLGLQLGLTPTMVGLTTAIVLASQVAGGSTATVVGRRLPQFAVQACTVLAGLCAFCVLGLNHVPAAFMAAAAVFGFIWLFTLPYQLLLLIEVDPRRRAALHLPAAQLLGSAAGPLVASLVVTAGDSRPAVMVGGAALLMTLSVTTGLRVTAARHRPP
jgi:MFS transporter, DHA1 family, inner membrane transport protein